MKNKQNINAMRGGTYSLIIVAIVLAILVVVNVFATSLPSSITNLDISSSKLYSITSNTKVVVNSLTSDVTIYWIVQSGEEDDIIENLLSKYESLSDHISVVKRNPDVYPTFASQYTDEAVQNNSLVVECGERSRFVSYSDIYVSEASIYSYSYTTSFDGEGAITSAIDYVVTEDLPKMYIMEGHGETELPSTIADQIEKENIETETLNLSTLETVPEDADAILIYAPSSDISEDEVEKLSNYVSEGGKLMVCAGTTEDGMLENLYSILEAYNITASDGVVCEADQNYFYYGLPYVLMPTMNSSDILDSLIEDNYYVFMPISMGLDTSSATGCSVTDLLTTSDTAYSKVAGYDLETYEKEDGDVDGPFSVAITLTDSQSSGQIVWFASSYVFSDEFNAYSSGANVDMGMNALSSLMGEREAMAIRSKSLNYNYLTISESDASRLQIFMIGMCPLVYLGIGIYVVVRRRRLQNETL